MNALEEKFEEKVRISELPRLAKWSKLPLKHLMGLTYSYGLYPVLGSRKMRCDLFSGEGVSVPLPAGLDIYLIGIKTHSSEVRLARYIMSTFREEGSGTVALDCGGHIGYYSILLSHYFRSVCTFEASPETFSYLADNTVMRKNIAVEPLALSDRDGQIQFFTLPTKYSESSTSVESSVPEAVRSIAEVISVKCRSLDSYVQEHSLRPEFIKIDVEGAEFNLLKGAATMLEDQSPIIAMEIRNDDFDQLYSPAIKLLNNLGYEMHSINDQGQLQLVADIKQILSAETDSDNFIFKKPE